MKLLIKLAVAAVIILIIVVVGLFFYIDTVARRAVEVAATRAMGVETTLGKMDVGIATSSVDLGELRVSNPEGFSSPHFLKLDEGTLAVSVGTLMKDQVVIPQLRLEGLDMHLEKKGGKANYQVIMDNMSQGTEPTPEEEASQKKFIINDLVLRDITVHADILPIGGSLTATKITIPEILLKDVGSESGGGVVLSELSGIIVKAIMQAIIEKSGALPADMVAELGAGLGKLEDIQAEALEVIGGAGNEVNEAVGETAKEINKVTKGIGDLLGGSKKKESTTTPETEEK